MHQASPDIVDSIIQWMETFVEVPHPSFGNLPPCPYARQFRLQNKIKIVECNSAIWDECRVQMRDWSDEWEAVILASKRIEISPGVLHEKIQATNRNYMRQDLVALEDHPHDPEVIDGVKMNHGELVLVVIQRLKRLNQFSQALRKKNYYDRWSKQNLDDVVNWRTSE